MSYTKYVMRDDGIFGIISKLTGVEHSTLATLLGNPAKVTHAGFLYQRDDDLISYGKSISTGKASDPEDGPTILQAIKDGKVFLVENERVGFFYATNHPEANDCPVASMAGLLDHRILERD